MRHNVGILLGEDLRDFATRLAKYIYKYGEGNAEDFLAVQSWVKLEDGSIGVMKAELNETEANIFESTTRDLYSTCLVYENTFEAESVELQQRRYLTNLHQKTVTINNGGDNSKLLLTIYLPLYDTENCNTLANLVNSLTDVHTRFSIMVVGLCNDLCGIISQNKNKKTLSPEDEAKLLSEQKVNIENLAKLRLEANVLEQVVIIQNINSAGYALNLEADSLVRILGEISLLTVEKYSTVFSQAIELDHEHPLCALGLSVLNLDKYYFANYILRRSYLHIMERENVAGKKVDLNKVAIEADKRLKQHQWLFSKFYSNRIEPLVRLGKSQDEIVSQISPLLEQEINDVTINLTDYITKDEFTLPEKQALLAVMLGYDDQLLQGDLFNQEQLTIENLDEEVADLIVEANNKLVTTKLDDNGNQTIEKGPIKVCCGEDGKVIIPINQMQQLRKDIRESTNYIRKKNEELKEIEKMTNDVIESEKLLTVDGFVFEGRTYHFDIEHQEVKFEDDYIAKPISETSVDLRSGFTPIKDQGEMGACTVFTIASIFEYILRKNLKTDYDLSESFVYYNVRHAKGDDSIDTGSSYQDVITSIGTEGICTEQLHPYSMGLTGIPSAEAYADGKKRRIVKALNVTVTEEDIKSAIQEGYPVAISLKVFNSFSSTTFSKTGSKIGTNGFVSYPRQEEIESNEFGHHAMVIVGYTDETKLFVVRNSWGTSFGDEGYCYIPYSYICDPELNRMSCIITEVDISETETQVGGRGGESTIVQFNMNDAFIKKHVIKNLLDAEERNLVKMRAKDMSLRNDYETLMQNLGKQSMRRTILEKWQNKLKEQISSAKSSQRQINEEIRSERLKMFDKDTIVKRFALIIWDIVFVLLWLFGLYEYSQDGISNLFFGFFDWTCSYLGTFTSIFMAIGLIITILYWSWIQRKRRRIEMELEAESASYANKAHQLSEQLKTSQLKFHIAGMVIDGLLSLKTNLDKNYNVLKSYIANLAQWQKEEKMAAELMEPLVKNPFIPLLNNEKLNSYFNENAEEITSKMHLYEYFNRYNLDDESIIAFKKSLKEEILKQVNHLLEGFSIFRHVFNVKDYPYLDKEIASAKTLFPMLDCKSEPFCQIRRNVLTKHQGRLLFINTDSKEKSNWQREYPQYFTTMPVSEDICSVYKVIALRLQPLTVNELWWGCETMP